MTTISLRPYLPTDAEPLAELFRASIEELSSDDYDEAQRTAWAERADDEEEFGKGLASMLTLIAMLEGEIVGFVSLKDKDSIDMLYVHPDAARMGVATSLVDALEKLATARGASELKADASETASPFFTQRGYASISRNTILIGDEWLANTTMSKKLSGPAAPKALQ